MKFTRNSGLVKTWVSLVMGGIYKLEQVPKLFGLRDIVTEVIKELAE